MGIFEEMAVHGHEQVIYCHHPQSGLKAIIALHNTTMGPALGGCRMRPYATEDEALQDVLRLARGMTYKNAAADVDFGGGKAVILGDPHTAKSPELFRAFGRFLEGLNGRFYTGTDMGTVPEDFVHAARESRCLVGLPTEFGGSGDSSVPTAVGVMAGLRAVAQHLWGSQSLAGRRVAIQGVGKVGAKLARMLDKEGARVIVSDVDSKLVEQISAHVPVTVVPPDDIFAVECDIFAPCAIGGILNDQTIPRLRCAAVGGSANNQLAEDRHGYLLHERGILYAPDYIINAGGLIQVADELIGFNPDRVLQKTGRIYEMLLAIFRHSASHDVPTSTAADHLVEERLERVAHVKRIFARPTSGHPDHGRFAPAARLHAEL